MMMNQVQKLNLLVAEVALDLLRLRKVAVVLAGEAGLTQVHHLNRQAPVELRNLVVVHKVPASRPHLN